MRNYLLALSCCMALSCCTQVKVSEVYTAAAENSLRAPAVPLVTIDPYTSAWSFADQLNDESVRHWTGRDYPLLGGIRVDGKSYRFMGMDDIQVTSVIGMASDGLWEADYTMSQPAGDWFAEAYDPKSWKRGKAAFGTEDNPNRSTPWSTGDIWVRRTFDWPSDEQKDALYLQYSHDDNIEVYLNGKQIAVAGNGLDYDLLKEIPEAVAESLKPTGNVLAAHCRNNGGGAYVDMGIMRKVKRGDTFDEKAIQKSMNVMPTQTFYTFECGGVSLDLIFTAPFLLNDLEAMTSPFNYITYQVRSIDGKDHDVQLYLEATPQWAVNTIDQEVTFEKTETPDLIYLKTGTIDQEVLAKTGDDVRIDWGYFYLAIPKKPGVSATIDEYYATKKAFMTTGNLPAGSQSLSSDMREQMTVLAYTDPIGKVSKETVSGHLMIGYDDLYSIQYFQDNRMPYWKHDGKVDIHQAFEKGEASYEDLMRRCGSFDSSLMSETSAVGGKKYAELCAIAYRQAIAAHKLVTDKEVTLLFLSKENFINGSI